jgi:hypothetical protein
MTSRTFIFPSFDALELTETPERGFAHFEKLSPVRSGAIVASLRVDYNRGRWHPFFNEIVFDANAYAFSYTHKTLLLYFYEQVWGTASRKHLSQLNAIRTELKYLQINLLVITSGSLRQFGELSWTDGLSLEVYEDRNNEQAALLRLYSEHAPAWNRYAGIEGNAALPGLYLLDQARQVAFAYPNEEIVDQLPLEKAICALSANSYAEKKSA